MNIKQLRKQTGLTQSAFWGKVSITQSGGSRYESGRTVPGPVQLLISLAYGNKKDRARVAKRLGLAL
jgi:transcriptional regulator with XRE-family HTH domain